MFQEPACGGFCGQSLPEAKQFTMMQSDVGLSAVVKPYLKVFGHNKVDLVVHHRDSLCKKPQGIVQVPVQQH